MTEPALSKTQFSRHVAELLAGRDQTVIEAGKLTEFSWKTLCFERDDQLLLKFSRDEGESVLALPYEEFFVDEGYVANSLESVCVRPDEWIVIRKKYPVYQGPIEFQKVAQGG